MRVPARDKFEAIINADPGQRMYTASRYYSRLYRRPFIARLKTALRLLGERRYANLLDLGFGSGFFIPELSLHCDRLYGVDIHHNIPAAKEMLNGLEEVQAQLAYGDILHLPWKDASFDCVICLSVLEFVNDTDMAIAEISRIAKDSATVIIGAPILNKLTDFCYDKIVKSKHHRLLHKSGHKKIINSAKKYLSIRRIVTYPFFAPLDFSLFFVLEAYKKGVFI